MMLLHQSICHGHSGTWGRSPFKREVIIQARLLFTCQICLIFRQETRCHKCQRDPTNKCEFCDRWAWFATTISWALWFFILIVFRLICWAHRRFCYLSGRDKRVSTTIKMYFFKTMIISLKQHPDYYCRQKTVLCFDCQKEWVVFVTFIPCLKNIPNRSLDYNWRLDWRDNSEGNAPLLNAEGSFLPGSGLEDYVE